ncbi:MAG TPA: hypothetical protein VEI02_09050, partial [Planctomycetota bacterium]|nr:hypothetical protein [Planctomycetota bacterium]
EAPVRPAPTPAPAPAVGSGSAAHGPAGGRTYHHGEYAHEYHRRSRPRVSVNVHIGPTYVAPAPAYVPVTYGYAYGRRHVAYHPYWHCPPPVYAYYGAPVYYAPAPVYVAPVYYAPVYPVYPVYASPAYPASSIAFGFSSFGGSTFTSFGFAWSSSRYVAACGWAPRPVYTIYTPVVETYYRSVWVPGYYSTYEERVWIPGRYVERVRTPTVEFCRDPLGNAYEVVVEAGAVDYVWEPGRYAYETRRVWNPGHWETVAVF